MRLSSKAKLGYATAIAAFAIAACIGIAFWRASRALHEASAELADAAEIRFSTVRLDRTPPEGVEPISTPALFSDASFFHGNLYICGPTGLVKYDSDGKLIARYRVGLELPAAPLVSLATGMVGDASEPEILVATDGAGLLAIGEKGLRQILPEQTPYRELAAVLPLSTGRLLLGTAKKGVVVYDGKRITRFHSTLSDVEVTVLAGSDSSLWVGTINSGVFHWHAGQVDRFSEAEGLPDPRVLSLAIDGERAFVGTPLGVAEFRAGAFRRVVAPGFFARALAVRGQTLVVGTMDEGVVEVPLNAGRAWAPRPHGQDLPGQVQRLVASEGGLYALTEDGFYSLDEHAAGWRRVLAPEGALLADRDISALAFDLSGRLWVGYFDRGLDILDSDGQHATHVENEHVFCVNRILDDPGHDGTMVATANGLVLFDGAGRQKQVLGRAEGLIADHVTDVVLTPDGLTLATPVGITTVDASGSRSIYAFHGLVNNHVYALAVAGSRVLAGTLGGLSILDDGRVRVNYTTANSGLKHNWITAIVQVGEEWFVGTYGGGILRLDTTGHWQTFPEATGCFDVNPNAMLATDSRVYAGTLGKALYVYDRASGRWTVVTAGLPSTNVTALTVRGGYVYVGTDNGLVRIAEQNLVTP